VYKVAGVKMFVVPTSGRIDFEIGPGGLRHRNVWRYAMIAMHCDALAAPRTASRIPAQARRYLPGYVRSAEESRRN